MTPSDLPVRDAVERLAAGDLVAFPTETTWGLGADARSEGALEELRRLKGREAGKPVSVLVPDATALASFGARLDEATKALLDAFWPGPLTLVIPCEAAFAIGVTGSDGRVGFRCSSHPVARDLVALASAGGVAPITATSLNRAGEPDCRTRREARRVAGAIPLVAGPDAGGGAPSTVVAVEGGKLEMLRKGAIPASAIANVLAGDPPR